MALQSQKRRSESTLREPEQAVSNPVLSLPTMGELTTLTTGVIMSNATLTLVSQVNALLEGTTIAPIVIPATPTVKSNEWMKRPASRKQVARTVEMASLKGIHTMRDVKSGEMMPITEENVGGMTAGGASKLYNAMKNLTVKENVTVKPATISVKE